MKWILTKPQTHIILKNPKLKDMRSLKGRKFGFDRFSGKQSLSVRLDLQADYEEDVKRALGQNPDVPIMKPKKVEIKHNKPPARKPAITTTKKVKETNVDHQSPGRKMYTRVSAGSSPVKKTDNSGKKTSVKESM